MNIRCISRGGLVRETELVEITKDRVVLLRWPNGAGIWDFMLAHGGQRKRPAGDWKWRIHPEDLATLQEQARTDGIERVMRLGVPTGQATRPRAPREPKVHPKQLGFFKS